MERLHCRIVFAHRLRNSSKFKSLKCYLLRSHSETALMRCSCTGDGSTRIRGIATDGTSVKAGKGY